MTPLTSQSLLLHSAEVGACFNTVQRHGLQEGLKLDKHLQKYMLYWPEFTKAPGSLDTWPGNEASMKVLQLGMLVLTY